MQSNPLLIIGVPVLVLTIAFYGLIARERKAPYLVKSSYQLFFLLLLETLFAIGTPKLILFFFHSDIDSIANRINLAFLVMFIIITFYIVFNDYNRYYNLRSDSWFGNILSNSIFKKAQISKFDLPNDFIDNILKSKFCTQQDTRDEILKRLKSKYSISTFCNFENTNERRKFICELTYEFLRQDYHVQFTSCTRHPIEFINEIKSCFKDHEGENWEQQWKNKCQRIILIDAHTTHFGFNETIYSKTAKSNAKNQCYKIITSRSSYAGIHTALIRGFNALEKKYSSKDSSNLGNKKKSDPALLIYENTSALIDIESKSQFKIFLRHVIPSERLMGGMFTVFCEDYISSKNYNFISSMTDITFHLENKTTTFSEKR